MVSPRKIAINVQRFVVYRLLHADDTPHRLALGVALGIFIAWTPTIGLQMILVLLFAPLLRANGRVGLPLVWISNPLTFPIIYYPNYALGRYLVGIFRDGAVLTFDEIVHMLGSLQSSASHFYEAAFWRELAQVLLKLGMELWVGSTIMALFLGVISYIVSYKLIVWYRLHTPLGRRHAAKLERSKKHNP